LQISQAFQLSYQNCLLEILRTLSKAFVPLHKSFDRETSNPSALRL
jgi:hypothetical protein